MSPLVSATHVQVIKKQAKEFLSEMDAQAIARALHGMALIPEPVKNSILQSMSTQDANVELLTFLRSQATEDQMKAIFQCASEQTVHGNMSAFAASILKQLPQGQFKCMVRDFFHGLNSLVVLLSHQRMPAQSNMDHPRWIFMGKISVQMRTEKWQKIAISNYAMLKVHADTCASVLKEEGIARPLSYYHRINKAIRSCTNEVQSVDC